MDASAEGPSEDTLDPRCRGSDDSPVTLVGVRGSRESFSDPDDGMGPTVSGIADRIELGMLREGVPLQLGRVAVAYPASSMRYRASRCAGVVSLGELLEHVLLQQPAVRFVLIGLSQGADVVRSAFSSGSLSEGSARRIAALILLGDPGRDPRLGEPFQHGTGDATPGLLAGTAPPLPRTLWSRAWAYCLEGDRVCAARIGRIGAIASGSHTRYGHNAESVQDRAAAFAIERLLERTHRRVEAG